MLFEMYKESVDSTPAINLLISTMIMQMISFLISFIILDSIKLDLDNNSNI